MAEPEYDRDSIDRAFAELVAGYHLTAERPTEPRLTAELASELTSSEDSRGEASGSPDSAEPLVLPTRPEPAPVPRLIVPAEPTEARPPDERYVPDPLPPLSRPRAPALVGWIGVLFAAVVVLAAGFGLDLPMWLGWIAVSCFIVGSVVLLTQLPRQRPPDAGDGAVL
jgi:hypothetical protein